MKMYYIAKSEFQEEISLPQLLFVISLSTHSTAINLHFVSYLCAYNLLTARCCWYSRLPRWLNECKINFALLAFYFAKLILQAASMNLNYYE
jgi:hypothetical protein